MIAIALQSGSSGNCIYVESDGVRVLLDAGISGVQAERRLARHGRDIRDVDAFLISHDHDDHIRSAGVFHRKYGIPLFITRPTLAAGRARMKLGSIADLEHFRAGDRVSLGPLSIETHATPHDAADGVVFVVDDGRRRLGVLTDLGHVFGGLEGIVASLDGVLIESNHDPEMLQHGPYPPALKRRISGCRGHISNAEAAHLIAARGGRLRWACLAHLSGTNNEPEIARRTFRGIAGPDLPLEVASRREVGEPLQL